MPKLTIDGIKIEVEPGTSILQAAEQLGIEIPRFCYHDKLSVPANCRMCLVEVSPGPPKPQASCALACADDMEVKTNSEMVKKARKGVLEMQLLNHPLDCPICDQGGECDLQDQAYAYGFDRSRYYEQKKAMPDKELGPLIKTVMTRCINCTRCVRFAEEVAGTPVLGQMHRGEDSEIGTFIENAVETELSGNLIDVCPVGALTSKPYAFTARPWELKKTQTIDVHDAVGCNIRIDSRGREVMRILPRQNDDVNEEWINDRSRFSYDGLAKNRLDRPYLRNNKSGQLEEVSWDEALKATAEKLKKVKSDKICGLAGDLCDVEAMVALKDLLNSLGSSNHECRIDGARFDVNQRSSYLFNSTIAGIEESDAILIVGSNPRWEATLVNTRIRKHWLENRVKIGVIGEEYDLSYPYEYLGNGPAAIEELLKGKNSFAKVLKEAKRPMLIVGSGAFQRDDGHSIQYLLGEVSEKLSLVTKDWNGFNVLHNACSRVGGLDIGFISKDGFNLADMKFVYLLGADDFETSSIDKKAFVVYQGHHGDNGAARADVIFPGAAYTEKNGFYVNTEGRVQRARKAVDLPGDAKEDWKILRALSEHIGKTLSYDNGLDLKERIVKEWEIFDAVGEVIPGKWSKAGIKGKCNSENFISPVYNFYLNNAICRASNTMNECSEAFTVKEFDNEHMEAAE
jgi:NADH-quinone oxidoreductase subunit G